MHVSLVRPQELTAEQRRHWDQWQDANADFHSPFLAYEYTQAVSDIRSDVFVALIEVEGELVGFFPFQRSKRNIGAAPGGPLSDRQAVILKRDCTLNLEELIRGCGLRAYDFRQLVASQASFTPTYASLDESVYLDLSEGFAAYQQNRHQSGTDILKQAAYRLRRAEKRLGEIVFVARADDLNTLDALIAWKQAQYVRTHAANVFSYGWTVELLRNLLTHNPARCKVVLSALYMGEQLAAVQYALQYAHVLHDWFPAFDREFAKFSPGLVLKYEFVKRCAELGVTRFDLGKNNMPHKASLASHSFMVATGSVALTPVTRMWRASVRSARRCRSVPWLQKPYEVAGRYVRPIRGWLALKSESPDHRAVAPPS